MLQLWFVSNTLLWQFNVELFGLKLGLNIFLLLFIGALWVLRTPKTPNFTVKVLSVLFVFLVLSYLAAIAGICTDKISKLVITAPVLFLLTFIGLQVGWKASDEDWLRLQKNVPWILLIAFAGLIVEMLYPEGFPRQVGYRFEGKFSGLFSEPSAVAFSLFPCLLILLVADSKWPRRIGMMALMLLLVLSRSSTLIVLTACWILFYQFIKGTISKRLLYSVGVTMVLVIAATVNYDSVLAPTVDRFIGVLGGESDQAENISSLVYLQGWQDAWANLQRTNGLGLGFNMMGCNPLPDTSARSILANTFNLELNSEDGSILFGKLVSEAGIVGILFFMSVVWWWLRLEKKIRNKNVRVSTIVLQMQSVLIFSFVATSLVRSSGYFSGGLLLMVVAIAASVKWRREHIKKS